MSEEINQPIKTYTQDELNTLMFETFAKLSRQPLKDLTSTRQTSLSFQKFTKEKIINFLTSPQKNEKNIRDASIYMYNNSSHYRRLITYYALMPVWAYVILPCKFDPQKIKADAYTKQYTKIAQSIENMQIPHEFQKIATVAFREDIFYGVVWETTDSFFIQRINPDWCELSSIEDGVYNYAIDMSKIKEEELPLYPAEFTTMWNTYQKDGIKKQEVPSKISACFKVNEDLPYPLPIFAGTMVSLHDIEDYKSLVKQRTEVGNYKMVNMQVPTKDGEPSMSWNDVVRYYNQMLQAFPDGVGGVSSPMKLDVIDFEKSGGLSDTGEVFNAEQQFWSSTGTSPLLFGGGNKNSVSSLKLSIKSDEMIVIGFMRQIERWINRRLKGMSGTIKFKVSLLPITVYNQEEFVKLYKEASTYGIPCKSHYAAATGLSGGDMLSMNVLETEVFMLQDKLIPLSSSHTQSTSGQVGRPSAEENDGTLTPSGEQTVDDDENAQR